MMGGGGGGGLEGTADYAILKYMASWYDDGDIEAMAYRT